MSNTPDISKEYIESTKDSTKLPYSDLYEIPESKDDNIQAQESPTKKQKTEEEIVGKPLTTKQLLEEVIQPDIAFLKESQIKIIQLLEKIIRTNLVKNIDVNNLKCNKTLSPK